MEHLQAYWRNDGPGGAGRFLLSDGPGEDSLCEGREPRADRPAEGIRHPVPLAEPVDARKGEAAVGAQLDRDVGPACSEGTDQPAQDEHGGAVCVDGAGAQDGSDEVRRATVEDQEGMGHMLAVVALVAGALPVAVRRVIGAVAVAENPRRGPSCSRWRRYRVTNAKARRLQMRRSTQLSRRERVGRLARSWPDSGSWPQTGVKSGSARRASASSWSSSPQASWKTRRTSISRLWRERLGSARPSVRYRAKAEQRANSFSASASQGNPPSEVKQPSRKPHRADGPSGQRRGTYAGPLGSVKTLYNSTITPQVFAYTPFMNNPG